MIPFLIATLVTLVFFMFILTGAYASLIRTWLFLLILANCFYLLHTAGFILSNGMRLT